MGFIAHNIISAPAHKAPIQYESIQAIAEAKPKGAYEDIALLELDKTSIVAWYVKDKGGQRLASEFFVVTKERIMQARGARYAVEKEAFVKKYWNELFDYIIVRNLNWKHADCVKITRLAQDEVGYSATTSVCDVYHAIGVEFMKQYRGKRVN